MSESSGKPFLSINNITAMVRDMLHEEVQPVVMAHDWVKLFGIPKKHRRVDRLMEGLKMLGRSIVVDELSLIGLGPVMMKFSCKALEKLNGVVEVWFNHEGYHIKVDLEHLPRRVGEGAALGSGPSDKQPPSSSDKVGRALTSGTDNKYSGGSKGKGKAGSYGDQETDADMDTRMAGQEDELEDSIEDTSFDTETWDLLGAPAVRAMVVATKT
ncbi:hypothetical protein ZWY2020_034141 [Hordeum vulgare]|nr:hypothetical protein ZWY2020_034141 [Hordeum vulgare]